MKSEELELMWAAKTFADFFNLHVETVRVACRDGRIAAVKAGRQWRIRQEIAEKIKRSGFPCKKPPENPPEKPVDDRSKKTPEK